jgi:tetratricopeptide (TPR) repeat protein
MPEALEMARRIVTRFPTLPEGPLYLAEATIENARGPQDYEAAREALQEARKRRERLRAPDQFALEFLSGRSYFEQGRWRDALPFLERANDIVPDNPDMLFQLGRTYRALGNARRADLVLKKQKQAYENIAMVRRLTARICDDPRNPAPRARTGPLVCPGGRPGQRVGQYEEMIARGPGCPHAEAGAQGRLEQANADALPR